MGERGGGAGGGNFCSLQRREPGEPLNPFTSPACRFLVPSHFKLDDRHSGFGLVWAGIYNPPPKQTAGRQRRRLCRDGRRRRRRRARHASGRGRGHAQCGAGGSGRCHGIRAAAQRRRAGAAARLVAGRAQAPHCGVLGAGPHAAAALQQGACVRTCVCVCVFVCVCVCVCVSVAVAVCVHVYMC